jgi:hypothetical protein
MSTPVPPRPIPLVVERKRGEAQAVVLEVELQHSLQSIASEHVRFPHSARIDTDQCGPELSLICLAKTGPLVHCPASDGAVARRQRWANGRWAQYRKSAPAAQVLALAAAASRQVSATHSAAASALELQTAAQQADVPLQVPIGHLIVAAVAAVVREAAKRFVGGRTA